MYYSGLWVELSVTLPCNARRGRAQTCYRSESHILRMDMLITAYEQRAVVAHQLLIVSSGGLGAAGGQQKARLEP